MSTNDIAEKKLAEPPAADPCATLEQVTCPSKANGDWIRDFAGNGAGIGDVVKFVGYGPGATLNQIDAYRWVVASADNSIQDVITFENAASLSDFGDYVFV